MTRSDYLEFPFSSHSINSHDYVKNQKLQNWPVVYLLYDKSQIYIGESINANSRLTQHLSNDTKCHLTSAFIVVNEEFNKSVSLDLESELIKLFAADSELELLNNNMGISDSDYFQREKYKLIFEEIFVDLHKKGFFSKSKKEIINSDIFKFSPYKSLNDEQNKALSGILQTLQSNFQNKSQKSEIVISGGPGTGKTVMAIFLTKFLTDIRNISSEDINLGLNSSQWTFDESLSLWNNLDVGIVIPQQGLRKTIEKVFARTPGLSKDMILTPYQVGESEKKFDILIVEESHRLNRRANQPSASLNMKWPKINEKLFSKDDFSITQLDWLREQCMHLILMIDPGQTVISRDLSQDLTNSVIEQSKSKNQFFELKSQMRLSGGNGYLDFVNRIFSSEPKKFGVSGDYDLRFFESFSAMRDEINKLNSRHSLCRIVSGNAFAWNSKRNPESHDIEIEGVPMFWNRVITDWINSPTSLEEVGCIHTVQGYDLNYTGVIIGKDLRYDENKERLYFDRSNFHDKAGMQNNKQLGIYFDDEDILEYVLNTYRVLLTRGVMGTFVYIQDEPLRRHLREYFH